MPDWTTHVITGWIAGKATKMNISLVIIGSLLPDLAKVQLFFDKMEINTHGIIEPLHTPLGTMLVALLIALLFPKIKDAFIAISAGVATHYFLDFFLMHVSGGMKLLFPFSWREYQMHLISSDNYWVTVFAIITGLIFYFIFKVESCYKK